MVIKSIESENKVDQVFYQMKRKILDDSWGLGDKIPSEKELCDMFGVSRVSVRSAIQKLRSVGLIDTFQGRGSFVTKKIDITNSVFPKMTIDEKDFKDIIEFRELIEYKSIELAVENADEEDIRNMEDALNRMLSNKNDYEKYSIADYEFHFAIVKASKNKIFYTVMESISSIFQYYLQELNRVFGINEKSTQGHKNLLESIKNKDADTAKKIIEEGIEDNFLKLNR
ncbi:FadR/GntR family transcriptional regulator [Gracilibacillus massiliensis]|uniref:FadR/GntR family transcriptional regulator n=1 Tax=Gracilibacillus massiliensis TaxID=1564956 RepID=UPI00071DC96C|nr:FadR/GntR family transcriptional regulator [Gracilibacillus massiliensis]